MKGFLLFIGLVVGWVFVCVMVRAAQIEEKRAHRYRRSRPF